MNENDVVKRYLENCYQQISKEVKVKGENQEGNSSRRRTIKKWLENEIERLTTKIAKEEKGKASIKATCHYNMSDTEIHVEHNSTEYSESQLKKVTTNLIKRIQPSEHLELYIENDEIDIRDGYDLWNGEITSFPNPIPVPELLAEKS